MRDFIMVNAFQKMGYFIWRHLLVISILFMITAVLLNHQTLSLLNSAILLTAFAAFDFAKTKWIKIDSLKKEHLKKFAKFIWRHLLTLSVICLVLSVFIAGRIPGIEGTIITTMFAIFFDSLKRKKSAYGSYYGHNHLRSPDTFDNLNPTHCGSAAWNMNPYNSGSTAYYTSSNNRY